MGLGCCKDEDGVPRRLLQRLQKGVPGRGSNHVSFIDDIDLISPRDGGKLHIISEFSYFVDTPVGCGVYLNDVYRPT